MLKISTISLAALPTPQEELANPQQERGFWSRFTNPSQSRWWNPLSWNKNKLQGGQNTDAKHLMDSVLQHLTNIGYSTQRMKLSIQELKTEIARGPFDATTKRMATRLNPNNWAENNQTLTQLHGRLRDPRLTETVNLVEEDVRDTFQYLRQIQTIMRELRRNQAVIGRDIGRDQYGRPIPHAMSSPSEEFDALQSVMNRLYTNPLDEDLINQAEHMHSRLDDRLRGIRSPWKPEHGPDETVMNWYTELKNRGLDDEKIIGEIAKGLKITPEKAHDILSRRGVFPPPAGGSTTVSPVSDPGATTTPPRSRKKTAPPEAAASPTGLTTEDRGRLKKSFDSILNNFEGGNAEKARKALDMFSLFKTIGIVPPEAMPKIEALEAFAEETMNNAGPTTNIPEAEVANSNPSEEGLAQGGEENPDFSEVEQAMDEYRNPPSSDIPSAGLTPEEYNSLFDLEDEDAGANSLWEQSEKRRQARKNKNASTTMGTLIKIADDLDRLDPEIADLLDKYIEIIADDKLPDFPKFSPLIREK